MAAFSTDNFSHRHIGPNRAEQKEMLQEIGVSSLDQLINEVIPPSIRVKKELDVSKHLSEAEYLDRIEKIGAKNKVFKSYIGQGYYGTETPSVILRNIFQNPGWYTQYTPYQAEISQGRLEALLNFQTTVSDLTGLPIANASLLDEATAAAEAMSMFHSLKNKKRKSNPAKKFFVDKAVFKQTLEVVKTRAVPLGIEIVVGDWETVDFDDNYFGVLLQYPDALGSVNDYSKIVNQCKEKEIFVCAAADILSLVLLKPPGEWGADAVVGSTQRLGVPMGYGGPHAGYFATKEAFKRLIPGRVIGVSQDRKGSPALRMALQTREQHIKREKATSNICTAQALLAVMAGMYAVYHGSEGLKHIAKKINDKTRRLYNALVSANISVLNNTFFDTLTLNVDNVDDIRTLAESKEVNFYYPDANTISISLDEITTEENLQEILDIFSIQENPNAEDESIDVVDFAHRKTDFLTHPIFSSCRTETQMMRYIKSLENKDLSLVHSMIPLGSCTMKLNAATQLIPVSFPEFADIHPFAPLDQTKGYQQIFDELEKDLCTLTGFTACSLQPNSGAQGEFAGLMAIRRYHEANGQTQRNVAIIPSSAHGTNPASAVLAGMKVVIVKCDDKGNIDLDNLKEKLEEHADTVGALMITYPSTHGVYEPEIKKICEMVHKFGGLIYMDGANMNAQVGLTNPGEIGADVCHLNLHKTFAIPHGGGGPGMGPICCNDKLKPYIPGHYIKDKRGYMVAAAPWGSASILLISHAYIQLLGKKGLREASEVAILNANYLKSKLEKHYQILYSGVTGRAAHEFIVDLRMFKPAGISAEDIAKRLIDYGFHAPTLAFPVPGTIMIEPTESEDKAELDLFCEAMIQIRKEIDEVARGEQDPTSNCLINAPHPIQEITSDHWDYSYSREKAAYPLPYLKMRHKFWTTTARVDNAYGDRNLVCTCPPIESYQ